jgi:hypothetical protein
VVERITTELATRVMEDALASAHAVLDEHAVTWRALALPRVARAIRQASKRSWLSHDSSGVVSIVMVSV